MEAASIMLGMHPPAGATAPRVELTPMRQLTEVRTTSLITYQVDKREIELLTPK